MKIIIGLGNPGKKYLTTRHNAGFMAVDFVIADFGLRIEDFHSKFQSELLSADQTVFAKPQTFMNNSGETVRDLVQFYKIDINKDLLIVHDEVDLPFGTVRSTESSSSAGHNGIKDIIEKLGTQDFHRIRIGVESRASDDPTPTDSFVLSNFSEEELAKLKKEILPKVKDEIEKFLKN